MQAKIRVVLGKGYKRRDEMRRRILERVFQSLRIALNLTFKKRKQATF